MRAGRWLAGQLSATLSYTPLPRGHGIYEELKAALADRYEFLRELGGGGMSHVFVAREIALDREVVVKVLPADLASGALLERFRREIGVAARLTHPNILGVLTAGEAAGLLYYTMPFVAGESLRAHLERDARISVGQATTWTTEVADALAYAHEHGVIHRDVKPDNILLLGGHAVLTDFGIAKAMEEMRDGTLTATGMSLGTPMYMAPEQAAGETAIDGRADVYALGCVFYELLAGQPPFSGRSPQAIIAQHMTAPFPLAQHSRPDLLPEIDRVIQKATTKRQEDRWQTMREFATEVHRATQPAPAVRTSGISRAWIALAAALVLVAGIFVTRMVRGTPITAKDTILIGDIENTTGDTVFDGTLRQALTMQLRQTPYLNLYPEDGITEALRLMAKPDTTRITEAIGREICQRRGIKALISGSIRKFGAGYLLSVTAIDANTGATLAEQQRQVGTQDSVLTALQKVAVDVRAELREPLRTITTYNAPIEQATTSSLQALNAYSKGLEQMYRGNAPEALPLLQRAVELDSNFVSAYNWISWANANLGNFQRTQQYAERAYALRSRATELERLHVTDAYYMWVTGEWEKQFDIDNQLKQLYPNDWLSYNNSAITRNVLGDFTRGLEDAKQGIVRNPNEVHLYWHGAFSLLRLGRYEEMRRMIQNAKSHHLDHPAYRGMMIQASAGAADSAKWREAVEDIRANISEQEALVWQARAAAFHGRWREAQTLYERGGPLKRDNPTLITEANLRAPLFGPCNSSDPMIARALSPARVVSPRGFVTFSMQIDGALCGSAVAAQGVLDTAIARYPGAATISLYLVPELRAAVALQRGKPEEALAALEPVRGYEAGAFLASLYLRGNAYRKLGRYTEAVREFQAIVDHRSWDILSPLYPLAWWHLARVKASAGDAAGSAAAEQQFRTLWRTADPDALQFVMRH